MIRLVQLVALLLVLQISGIAHRVADLVFHDDCAAQCGHEGTTGGDNDSECPPGCPTCHACAHVQAPYVPIAPSLGLAPLLAVVAHPHTEQTSLPRGEMPFVYRPPRAPRFASA